MEAPAARTGRLDDKDAAVWRKRLLDGGFTEQQADVLTSTEGVDLHRVEELVQKHGCPHELAFDIAS